MNCTNRTQKKIMAYSALFKKWAFSMKRNTKISKDLSIKGLRKCPLGIHKLLSCSIRSVKPPPFNLRKGGDCRLLEYQGGVGDVVNLSGSKSIDLFGCTQLVELMHLKFENYINDGHFLASRREFIEKGYEKFLALLCDVKRKVVVIRWCSLR
ncbi:hypothetical protein KEH51_06845 [[Brevibacterium] frigoritolerans]|uniref:Uncharacterized protein n=1 Tax=Peribacillus frigoritolerans TaxID=450367 RepID=A0A941FJ98_9BACI|nr:hypothetical protein [Peribacillus frigoritolerans]